MTAPIALTCGDPSGVGPEIAAKARARLGADLDFFWIGDPSHLPQGTSWGQIARPADAARVAADHLPVLRHEFPAAALPGAPAAENAAAVSAGIARAVALAMAGEASASCPAAIHKRARQGGAGVDSPG